MSAADEPDDLILDIIGKVMDAELWLLRQIRKPEA